MSTQYQVECAECPNQERYPEDHDESCGVNYTGFLKLQRLFLRAPDACQLMRKLGELGLIGVAQVVVRSEEWHSDAADFLSVHGDHQLIMRNEYGEWYPFDEVAK